jgi:hypothetical protein
MEISTLLTSYAAYPELCKLLSKNSSQVKSAIDYYANEISRDVGERDFKRIVPEILAMLITADAFHLPSGDIISPLEVIKMIEGIVFWEILYEEYLLKSGRRSFFISNYKSVHHSWVFLALDFLIYKAQGKSPRDLLSLALGVGTQNMTFALKLSKQERINAFVMLSRKNKVGIFQNESFVGFVPGSQFSEIIEIMQYVFDEIDHLKNYFERKEGLYFNRFGNVKAIMTLSQPVAIISPSKTPIKEPIKSKTPLEKALITLKLSELPVSKRELKKVFYKFAISSHPDKFDHVDKGTRTEIAITEKFTEINNAYEIVEQELDRLGVL